MTLKDKSNFYQWDVNQVLVNVSAIYIDFIINDEVYRVHINQDRTLNVPDEFLQTAGTKQMYLCYDNGTYELCEVEVLPRPTPPDYIFTPTQRATFESLTRDVEELVNDVNYKVTSGYFNGKDGKNGRDGIDGRNGTDGRDGKDGIDGKDGTNGRDGTNGTNGTNGVDGYSPIVVITPIDNGNRLIITDKYGQHVADILNGKDGSGGGMEYYKVTYDGNSIRHDGVVQTFELLVDKFNDDDYFLYAEANGLVMIPALPPIEGDSILEFSCSWVEFDETTISRLIINSDNQIKFEDIKLATREDINIINDEIDVINNGTAVPKNVTWDGYRYSMNDYLEIAPSTSKLYVHWGAGGPTATEYVYFYDETKTQISRASYSGAMPKSVNVPANAKYVKTRFNTTLTSAFIGYSADRDEAIFIPLAEDLKTAGLKDKVSNTDIATDTKLGIVRSSMALGIVADTTGILHAVTLGRDSYPSYTNDTFISKGTLENVLNAGNIRLAIDTYIKNGVLTAYSGWSSTDYLSVKNNRVICYTENLSNYCAWYDSNKAFISMFQVANGFNDIMAPANAKYVRFSMETTKLIKFIKIDDI